MARFFVLENDTVLTLVFFFFFNDTATTEIYTLSLHDALPILPAAVEAPAHHHGGAQRLPREEPSRRSEEQRLNSSHLVISYAVFCLKKKTPRISIPPRSASYVFELN